MDDASLDDAGLDDDALDVTPPTAWSRDDSQPLLLPSGRLLTYEGSGSRAGQFGGSQRAGRPAARWEQQVAFSTAHDALGVARIVCLDAIRLFPVAAVPGRRPP
ncbi:MAG: hypothetical protein U0935_18995 [Pirellulales bacterium]